MKSKSSLLGRRFLHWTRNAWLSFTSKENVLYQLSKAESSYINVKNIKFKYVFLNLILYFMVMGGLEEATHCFILLKPPNNIRLINDECFCFSLSTEKNRAACYRSSSQLIF